MVHKLPTQNYEIKEKYNPNKRLYYPKYVKFWIISTIILGIFFIIIISIFLLLIANDKFRSVVTQTVNPLFNASVIVLNEYKFTPNTINEITNMYNNNFSVYVNLNKLKCIEINDI